MRLGIFGATGDTGLCLVRFALEQGYTVTALARTPSKLVLPVDLREAAEANLTVIQGDIGNQTAVDEVVRRSDIILEALGVAHNRPTTVNRDGVRSILQAMRQHQKNRLLAVTSAALDPGFRKQIPWLFRPLISFLMNHIAEDLLAEEQAIVAESDWLNYTIVRPPELVPVPATSSWIVSEGNQPPGAGRVPFADLACCMLDCAANNTHQKKITMINTTKRVKVTFADMKKQRVLLFDNLKRKILMPTCALTISLASLAIAKKRIVG